jgi:hypothetical protein
MDSCVVVYNDILFYSIHANATTVSSLEKGNKGNKRSKKKQRLSI